MSNSLPNVVASLCYNFDAWIVGSAASPDNNSPRDFDIQVPYSMWGPAASLIPRDARPNSFGGWKFTVDGVEIDMWPGELGWIMQNDRSSWAWHPRTNTRLCKFTRE